MGRRRQGAYCRSGAILSLDRNCCSFSNWASSVFQFLPCRAYSVARVVVRFLSAMDWTRAAVSMERAARLARESGKRMIFAVGNAPTALIRLHEMMELYKTDGAVSTDNMQNTPEFSGFMPDFVIGVPVGFVNVEAAKELIMETDVP